MFHFGDMAEKNISYFLVLVLPNKTSPFLHHPFTKTSIIEVLVNG